MKVQQCVHFACLVSNKEGFFYLLPLECALLAVVVYNMIVGDRARHSQVCSIEIRDMYRYNVYIIVRMSPLSFDL